MNLASPAFENHAAVPKRFTCEGENVSPQLEWSEVPEGTQELVVTCIDPDAPTGPFAHWSVWGLSPTTAGLAEGEVPPGARQGLNGFGSRGYRGPCPPPGHGTHHYLFTLLALGSKIDLAEGAAMGQLAAAIKGIAIDRAIVVGTYSR
jgi:Raf kinase inhibitor-like YbhB/YbcL family protein